MYDTIIPQSCDECNSDPVQPGCTAVQATEAATDATAAPAVNPDEIICAACYRGGALDFYRPMKRSDFAFRQAQAARHPEWRVEWRLEERPLTAEEAQDEVWARLPDGDGEATGEGDQCNGN